MQVDNRVESGVNKVSLILNSACCFERLYWNIKGQIALVGIVLKNIASSKTEEVRTGLNQTIFTKKPWLMLSVEVVVTSYANRKRQVIQGGLAMEKEIVRVEILVKCEVSR